MSKRAVDAVVLATSLFAAVALFGAAVASFDSGGNSSPRALIGSSTSAPDTAEIAAPLDLASAQQALAPFVPADSANRTSVIPMLGSNDAHGHTTTTMGHAHDDGMGAHEHADGGHAGGGHDHGTVENARVLADGNQWQGGPFEGWRIQWEPTGPNRTAAMRIINENEEVHRFSPTDAECSGVTPTQSNLDYGTWLVARTHEALQPYRNRPDRAIADGFIPYPLGNRYWHMINLKRMGSNAYVQSADPSIGDASSQVLNPSEIESFLYGMVDGEGLVPLGGMYMYGNKDAVPPAPFGCVTSWHRHEGSQGFITSFELDDQRSVWMFHVWDLEMIGPWGEHDGTHASDWWLGWRYLPNVCFQEDCVL